MKLSIIDEIVDDILEEGEEKNKIQVAKDMIKEGYSEEEILKISRITSKQLLTLLNV